MVFVTVKANIALSSNKTIIATKLITITNNELSSLYLSGSAIVTSNNINPPILMHQVKDTLGLVPGLFEVSTNLNSIGSLKFYISQSNDSTPVFGMGNTSGTLIKGGTSIFPGLSGEVLIRVDMVNKKYIFYVIDTMKITIMGSSVAYGAGSKNGNSGYATLYSQLLSERFNEGIGNNWVWSNISIGGNSTTSLLNRWDTDLLVQKSKYVIYGLSLANEGILLGGNSAYDHFKKNIQILIDKARSAGKTPILMSTYPNSGYNLTIYNYLKEMNLLIQQWDVPSVNLLGAVDDGNGKWVPEYVSDPSHPNDAGHYEMFLSICSFLIRRYKIREKRCLKEL